MTAAGDEPLSDDLEEARKILFPYPEYSEEEGRARMRAVLRRAEQERNLIDVLFERLRRAVGENDEANATVARARDVFRDIDDRTSEEVAEVVGWLEADPTQADAVFDSRFEAFQAGLRAGERL